MVRCLDVARNFVSTRWMTILTSFWGVAEFPIDMKLDNVDRFQFLKICIRTDTIGASA